MYLACLLQRFRDKSRGKRANLVYICSLLHKPTCIIRLLQYLASRGLRLQKLCNISKIKATKLLSSKRTVNSKHLLDSHPLLTIEQRICVTGDSKMSLKSQFVFAWNRLKSGSRLKCFWTRVQAGTAAFQISIMISSQSANLVHF